MMKKCLHIGFVFMMGIFILKKTFAQDTHFSQAFANPLKLNPAIMGPNSDIKIILNARNQWNNIDDGYNTKCFSVLYPWLMKGEKEKLDIGINLLSDNAGAFTTTDLSLSMGYNLKITRNGFLSFALQGGMLQRSLNLAELSFDEQYISGTYDPSNPIGETVLNDVVNYPDVGFGAMWYYNPSQDQNNKLNAYSGISVFHLNNPNESFTDNAKGKLPIKFSYQAGIKIFGDNKFDFTPNIRFAKQGGSQEIAPGMYVDYRLNSSRVILGTWYRIHDAVAFSLGFEHKYFTIGYSYDAVTDLKNYVSGSKAHEIALSLKLPSKKKQSNPMFDAGSENEESKKNTPPDTMIFSPF